MAEVKKYLDLGGLEIFWGKVKTQYEAADAVISKALADEVSRADAAEKANAAAIKVISDNYLKAEDKEALQSAINTEKGRIAAIEVDYLKAKDKTELEGKIDEKVAKSDYNTKMGSLDKSIGALQEAVDNMASDSTVSDLQSRVTTLEGGEDSADKGKSVRKIANEELAAQLLSGKADADFKSLQELAAWLEEHPESVAEINKNIQANAKAVADEVSRAEGEEAKIRGEFAAADATLKTELQGNIDTEKDRVDAIVVDYLKAKDKTELSNAIAAEATALGEVAAAIRGEFAAADSTLLGKITALEGVQGNYASAENLTAEVNRAKAAEDKIEASVGLAKDGSFVAYTDKHYINSASSVRGEIVKLDAALKSHVDAYTTKVGELATEDANIRKDFAAADTKIREDFAAADSALDAAYKAADSALETAYKAADSALSGRIDALNAVQGNYATKTELSTLESSFVAITSTEIAGIFE